jgi:ATP-binding cassette subfamily F protein uup
VQAIQDAAKKVANKDQATLGTTQKTAQIQRCSRRPAPAKLSYKDQRELEALPGRIDALEKEQLALRAELADGTIYSRDAQRAPPPCMPATAAIDDELMAAMERWEALSSALTAGSTSTWFRNLASSTPSRTPRPAWSRN